MGEAMRFALNSLAVVAGEWLLAHAEDEWLYRYGHRIEESCLPKSRAERLELAETIGRDGALLLDAVFDAASPPLLRELPAIELLRRIWVQNYWYENGHLHWRSIEDIPPSALYVGSPYDREARYSKKRSTTWVSLPLMVESSIFHFPRLYQTGSSALFVISCAIKRPQKVVVGCKAKPGILQARRGRRSPTRARYQLG
ncbi:MAG TPA: hypothetical protein VHZ51_09945 [Ktedonobacteraceae bacterium]|nr:hypothetical protein [Ktedonobacteraceae bacterium]